MTESQRKNAESQRKPPDREKVINELVEHIEATLSVDSEWINMPLDLAQYALAMLKKQEVGKWIKLQGMAPPEYHGHKICSVCESFAPYDPIHPWREMLSPYCPGCGAKMEASGND